MKNTDDSNNEEPLIEEGNNGDNDYNNNSAPVEKSSSDIVSEDFNQTSQTSTSDTEKKEKVIDPIAQKVVDNYSSSNDAYLNANIFSKLFFYWAYKIIKVN